MIHKVLDRKPKNKDAQKLLTEAEELFVEAAFKY